MDDVRQRGSGAILTTSGNGPASPDWPSWLVKIVYSVCAGAVATVAGAAVSLAVATTARVAVWCTVTGAVCVGAGILWSPGLVKVCQEAFSRWLGAASW
jgi:hypothetical protein